MISSQRAIAASDGHGPYGGAPDQRLTDLGQLSLVARALGVLERPLEQRLARLDPAAQPVRVGDATQRSRDARVVPDALEDLSRMLRCFQHVVERRGVGIDVRAQPGELEPCPRLHARVACLLRLCQRSLQAARRRAGDRRPRASASASSSRSSSRSGASSGSSAPARSRRLTAAGASPRATARRPADASSCPPRAARDMPCRRRCPGSPCGAGTPARSGSRAPPPPRCCGRPSTTTSQSANRSCSSARICFGRPSYAAFLISTCRKRKASSPANAVRSWRISSLRSERAEEHRQPASSAPGRPSSASIAPRWKTVPSTAARSITWRSVAPS